jgi:hypothetical protein
MLVMLGVHSGQRSTSLITAQTRSGGAAISIVRENSVIASRCSAGVQFDLPIA